MYSNFFFLKAVLSRLNICLLWECCIADISKSVYPNTNRYISEASWKCAIHQVFVKHSHYELEQKSTKICKEAESGVRSFPSVSISQCRWIWIDSDYSHGGHNCQREEITHLFLIRSHKIFAWNSPQWDLINFPEQYGIFQANFFFFFFCSLNFLHSWFVCWRSIVCIS